MFRKNYLIYVLMIAAVLVGSTAIFAQDAVISGRVQMTGGNAEGVAGALVQVYDQASKSKTTTTTTNEKGEFSVASLPQGQMFSLIVSGSGIDSTLVSDIGSGSTNINIAVVKGDGKQPTDEEIKKVLAIEDKGELTEEQKKARAEIEAKNAKATDFNANIKRLNDEGGKAFEKKNFDVAIAKFDEGYQLNTEFLGTAPGFLTNKGLSYRERAIKYYNDGSTTTDPTVKTDNYKKATKDFGDGIDAYYTSWTILKNATDAQKTEAKNYAQNKLETLTGARDLVHYAVLTNKIDAEKLDKAKELLNEYVSFETDKKKKAEGETLLADYHRLSFDYDTAITMYRKILSGSPNESGALYGIGLSLYTAAYADDGSSDKAKLQEAANFLKRFTDSAPSSAKREVKAAQETLEILKEAENISPKKN